MARGTGQEGVDLRAAGTQVVPAGVIPVTPSHSLTLTLTPTHSEVSVLNAGAPSAMSGPGAQGRGLLCQPPLNVGPRLQPASPWHNSHLISVSHRGET